VPVREVEETSAAVLADRLTRDLDSNHVLLRWLMVDSFGAVGTGVELPAWRRRAACAGMPVEQFVPHGQRGQKPDYGPALAVCETCEVRTACADDAYQHGDEHGVFGGLTPEARALARRDDRVAA
jgi:WhiB family transcriptional regulator, redox-sensing transcriptional regulator